MGRRTVAQFAHQIKRVSSPTALDDLGRRVAFCHRERLVTPWRLALSLLASHATGPVETLADMQRQFHALFGTTVAYKPFHNQLAKRSFKDFMRAVLDRVFPQWVVGVLQPTARGPPGGFGRIVIQDGGSFAVEGALREHYPGRFKKQNPAAVERHVTRSLLDGPVEQVTLTADTAPERPPLPSPEALRDDLPCFPRPPPLFPDRRRAPRSRSLACSPTLKRNGRWRGARHGKGGPPTMIPR